MKSLLVPVLFVAFTCLSFRSTTENSLSPLPLCTAMNKALADEEAGYSSLQGEALDKNDDSSENFTLKITFDGFSSNQYVIGKDGGYVELYNEHPTKEKAIAQYNAVVKQLETCLAVKGETIKHESLDRLHVITKGKSEIGIVVASTETKSILILTIEKTGKD
ncbi:MAG TPA: hypothetical protein VF487_06460 [Chitinophagaceae bacterium]